MNSGCGGYPLPGQGVVARFSAMDMGCFCDSCVDGPWTVHNAGKCTRSQSGLSVEDGADGAGGYQYAGVAQILSARFPAAGGISLASCGKTEWLPFSVPVGRRHAGRTLGRAHRLKE